MHGGCSHKFRILSALLLGLILLLSVPYSTYAQSSESQLEETHAKLKDDKSLQFELAEPIAPKPAKERKTRRKRNSNFEGFGTAIAGLFTYIFYGICAALVLTVIYFVAREFIHVRWPQKTEKEDEEDEEIPLYMPDETEAQVLLDDVDRLAQEGRYAEAVHTLLFRSIQDIERNRPHSIRQSLTSREIAKLEILTPDTRSAFSKIASVVELSFFGKRPLGKPEFEACRQYYAAITAPKAWA